MENFTLWDLATILIGLGVFVAVSMLLEDGGRRARAIWGFIMSRLSTTQPPDRAVADRLPATPTIEAQPIATPGNAVNALLPGNALPDEARAIIRFQAKVEATVAIVKSGKVGQTEAIELVFDCKRSGRPESDYARARAAVLPLLDSGTQYRPLSEEQRQVREALGLDRV